MPKSIPCHDDVDVLKLCMMSLVLTSSLANAVHIVWALYLDKRGLDIQGSTVDKSQQASQSQLCFYLLCNDVPLAMSLSNKL